jgi:hypothetical protein
LTDSTGWNAEPKKSNFNGRALLVIGVVVAGAYVFAQNRPGTPPSTAADRPDTPSTVQVTYELTGSADSADLTYTDASGNTQQHANADIPLRTTSGTPGMRFTVKRGAFVYFSAQNNGESGDLSCTIKAGGTVINTGHSSGGFTIVTCSATVP